MNDGELFLFSFLPLVLTFAKTVVGNKSQLITQDERNYE
jgi:hypothetical protein